jgi:hypothetical protein
LGLTQLDQTQILPNVVTMSYSHLTLKSTAFPPPPPITPYTNRRASPSLLQNSKHKATLEKFQNKLEELSTTTLTSMEASHLQYQHGHFDQKTYIKQL